MILPLLPGYEWVPLTPPLEYKYLSCFPVFQSILSSFLLHTYLSPLFPAQDPGAGDEEACIAQRGADSFLLSFGVVGGAIFDVLPTLFSLRTVPCRIAARKMDLEVGLQ